MAIELILIISDIMIMTKFIRNMKKLGELPGFEIMGGYNDGPWLHWGAIYSKIDYSIEYQ